LSGAIGVPEKLVLFSIGEVVRWLPKKGLCFCRWMGVVYRGPVLEKWRCLRWGGSTLGKYLRKGNGWLKLIFFFNFRDAKNRVGPEPIILNGVMGYLQMAENKWATGLKFCTPTYNW